MSVLAVTLHPDVPIPMWPLVLELFVQIQHPRTPVFPLLCFLLFTSQLYAILICAVGIVLANIWIETLH